MLRDEIPAEPARQGEHNMKSDRRRHPYPATIASLLALALVAAPAPSAHAADAQAPDVTAVALAPVPVDVTSASATIYFAYTATDEGSGVSSARITLGPASAEGACTNENTVVARQDFSATPSRSSSLTLEIPRYAPAGTWAVCEFAVTDATGNVTQMAAGDLEALGLPLTFDVTSDPDVTPPQLVGFAGLPASVDVIGVSAGIDVTLDLSDDLSGAVSAAVTVGPSVDGSCIGDKQVTAKTSFAASVSTTATVSLEIPRHALDGEWAVCGLELRDAVGNALYAGSAEVVALGALATFVVVSDSDVLPPSLVSFEISPASSDTRSSTAIVHFSWSATDDLSGILGIVLVVGPSTDGVCSGAYTRFLQVEYTPETSKSVDTQVTIPILSLEGEWAVCSVLVYDATRNGTILGAADLEAAGFTARFRLAQCGDGLVEGDETCDEGAANGTSTSCCSAACAIEAAGTACAEDQDPCTSDACSSGGACEHLQTGECESARSIVLEVSPEGGAITVPDGTIGLLIPPGALTEPTRIVIKGLPDGGTHDPGPGNRVISALEIGPKGLTFAKPVALSVAWADSDDDSFVDGVDPLAREAGLSIPRDGYALTGECRETVHRVGSCSTACCDQSTNRWDAALTAPGEIALVARGCGSGISGMRLAIAKTQLPVGDEVMTFQGLITIPPADRPAFDPSATGMRIQLDDGVETLLDVLLPASMWKRNTSGTTWKFSPGKTTPPAGIKSVVLKADRTVPGLMKFVAKGKNGGYTVGAGLTARLAIEQGACFAAGPDSPPPVPNCSASGSKVTCR